MVDAAKAEECLQQSEIAGSKKSLRQVRVAFVPFDNWNPYQRRLAENLRFWGVQVSARTCWKRLVRDILWRRDRSDVIHVHWLPRMRATPIGLAHFVVLCLRLLAVRMLGRRIVWTIHNLYNHELRSRRLEYWLSRYVATIASQIIVHSPIAQRIVAEEFHIQMAAKIFVAPHGNYVGVYPNTVGADEARRQLGVDADAVVALFFGNIRPYKGVAELLDAFRQIETSGATLLIVGRTLLDQESLKQFRAQVARDPRVRMHGGFVPVHRVQVYLNACDLVVFPYRQILTSGAVVLAMSFAKACLAPSQGCIPDVLNEEGAFLYDPRDSFGLPDALSRAFSQRAELRKMGAYNLKRCLEWDWKSVSQQTATIYDLARRGSAAR